MLVLFVYVYLALPLATYSLHFASTLALSVFFTFMSDAFPEICLELDTEPVCFALCFLHLHPLVTITGCPK